MQVATNDDRLFHPKEMNEISKHCMQEAEPKPLQGSQAFEECEAWEFICFK